MSRVLFHRVLTGMLIGWLCGGPLGLCTSVHAQAPTQGAAGARQRLPASVVQALRQAQVPASALSVQVVRLDASAPRAAGLRLSHRANEPVNPASVMKLITTYAGLSLLGPQHTWSTRIWTTGVLREDVLHGDLIVQGGGDPKLVIERLQALMASVRQLGVREVRGDLVLDRSVFDVTPRSEAFDDEPLRPYNVSPDGLLVNFKSLLYTFTPEPDRARASVRSEPPLAGLQVPTQVPLHSGPCQDWRAQLRADFRATVVRFDGAYPAACGERIWPVAYPEPEQFAPRVIQAAWAGAGGSLLGQVREGSVPAQARRLLQSPSLPLAEVIADINKMSNNVMAQQLFLTLSSEMGAPGRFEASRRRVAHWWHAQFAGLPEPVLDNGSGLSRSERSTAHALTALLAHAHHSPLRETWRQSLSVAGVDGTTVRLRERRPDSPLIGKAWLKTGSLRDVASVAGYVQGASGQLYAVAAILNHPQAHQARGALDALLEWTARDLPK